MTPQQNLRNALHPKIMELIIFPTEKCNFRCTYCYEDFAIGKMKSAIIGAIKNLIRARIERNSLEALQISWFGGEPLLAADVMYEISEFARDALQRGELKHLSGSVTTNGYLLRKKVIERLAASNQTFYQVSLDGFGVEHNATRKYIDGGGTFDVIWNNLIDAKKLDIKFEIMLRLHLTTDNLDSMAVLVDRIKDEFSGDSRFSIFFKTIENLGGPNASSIKKVHVEQAAKRVGEWSTSLRALGFRVTSVLDGPESARQDYSTDGASNLNAEVIQGSTTEIEAIQTMTEADKGNTPGFGGYICYASKPNSLMIRADGRIGKCTVMLDDDRNTIGHIKQDGRIELDQDKMNLWMRGFSTFDVMELGCPAKDLPKMEKRAEVVIPLESLKLGKISSVDA